MCAMDTSPPCTSGQLVGRSPRRVRRSLRRCFPTLVTPETRKELVERLGGHVIKVLKKKQGPGGGEDKVVEETVGGILHWGRETSNKAGLDLLPRGDPEGIRWPRTSRS